MGKARMNQDNCNQQFPKPILLNTPVYPDQRGYFRVACNFGGNAESFAMPSYDLSQLNISESSEGVFRGLHWQVKSPQSKYVFCISGEIMDIVVDIRKDSPDFGVGRQYRLNKHNSLIVPVGYAHGFLVLSKKAIVGYLVEGEYDQESERSLNIDDPNLGFAKTLHEAATPTGKKALYLGSCSEGTVLHRSDKDEKAPHLSQLRNEDLL